MPPAGPWVASVPTASHLRDGQRRDAWGRGFGHQGALLATLEGKGAGTRNGGRGGDWGLTTAAGSEPRKGRARGGGGARLLSHITVTPAATSPARLRARTQRGAPLSPPELFSGQPRLPDKQHLMHLCCKVRVMLWPEMGRREPPACSVPSRLCWLHGVTSDFKGASENWPVG